MADGERTTREGATTKKDEDARQGAGTAVQDFTEQLSLTNQALLKVKKALDLNHLEMSVFNKGIGAFGRAFKEANDTQKQLLSTNRVMADVVRANSEALIRLPTSFNEAIKTRFEFLNEGLYAAGRESLMLASVMKVTGGDIRQLVKMNKEVLTTGRASVGQVEQLNTVLRQVTEKQGISFDKLVTAVNGLSRRMALLGALGMTGEAAREMATMIGRLGAGSDQLVTQLFDKMFDPTAPMAQEMILGVFDQLQALRAPGGLTQSNLDAFVEAAGGSFDAWNEMAKLMPLQIGESFREIAGGTGGLGNIALQIETLVESMSEIDRALGESTSQLSDSVEVFKNEVWKPLQVAFHGMFRVMMSFVGLAPRFFAPLITGLAVAALVGRIRNISQRDNTIAINRNTMALLRQRGKDFGLAGAGRFLGGPAGMVMGAVMMGITAAMMPSLDSISDSTASLDDKTPEPAKATSMFADRSSMIIKEAIASTVFGGNNLLAAINSGQLELAGAMLRFGDIVLEDREDKGTPTTPVVR